MKMRFLDAASASREKLFIQREGGAISNQHLSGSSKARSMLAARVKVAAIDTTEASNRKGSEKIIARDLAFFAFREARAREPAPGPRAHSYSNFGLGASSNKFLSWRFELTLNHTRRAEEEEGSAPWQSSLTTARFTNNCSTADYNIRKKKRKSARHA